MNYSNYDNIIDGVVIWGGVAFVVCMFLIAIFYKTPKMKKAVLTLTKNYWWNVAELQIFEANGELKETIKINRYYEVDKDWVYIYNAAGGHDNIHRGELIRKVFIGDCEYQFIETYDTKTYE